VRRDAVDACVYKSMAGCELHESGDSGPIDASGSIDSCRRRVNTDEMTGIYSTLVFHLLTLYHRFDPTMHTSDSDASSRMNPDHGELRRDYLSAAMTHDQRSTSTLT
jgi:hypothetical protein